MCIGFFWVASSLLFSTPDKSLIRNSFPIFIADTISSSCNAPEYRQFDYWIGKWTVENRSGDVIGQSKISSVSDGCAILEEWNGASGVTGKSLNFYDSSQQQWRQTWVGGGGMILDLEGNLEDGNMTLYDEKLTENGPVIHRIRWNKLADGRIEQRWDTSTDGGETWEQAFLGLYERQN